MDGLLQLDRWKPNGMGGRAGASVVRTDGVRDMVLEVCARDVPTVPTRREEDNLEKAVRAILLWESVRLCFHRIRISEAVAFVADGLVRGSISHRASGGRAGDHAETRRELLFVGFGTTMQVVDAVV